MTVTLAGTGLAGRKVVVGVSGGIAAYKSAELVRALTQAGAEVRCIMTQGATAFLAPMTLQVLSGNRVGLSTFDTAYEHEIGHIELARWADVVLLAPATADLIARMRAGMANDLLTTVLLATRAPVVICPAMNTAMLGHAAVQENLAALAARDGVTVVAPDSGALACGEVGAGRLPDPPVILAHLRRVFTAPLLAGKRVVVTAGPTREYFDPVRFLSNPSSGKMGYAVAGAAWEAGADVLLLSGPVALAPPPGVARVLLESAAQLAEATLAAPADILVMCAAVADYTPAERLPQKRKKSADDWQPKLGRTVDILQAIAAAPNRPTCVVGFAAETQDVEENAAGKLQRKQLDGIVANAVGGPLGAFGSEHNTVTLLSRDGERQVVGPLPKADVARAIVAWLPALLAAQRRQS